MPNGMCLLIFLSDWLWYQYMLSSKKRKTEDTPTSSLCYSATLGQLKLSPGHCNLADYQSGPDTGALFAPRVLGSSAPIANKRRYPDDRGVTASSEHRARSCKHGENFFASSHGAAETSRGASFKEN